MGNYMIHILLLIHKRKAVFAFLLLGNLYLKSSANFNVIYDFALQCETH